MNRRPWACGAWVVLLGAAVSAQILGGHALDANMMVGGSGINTRTQSAGTGLSRPAYRAATSNPQLRGPVTSSRERSQSIYWTPASQPSGYGYREPAHGISYGTAQGPAFDVLAAPLYTPLQRTVQVERGSSGGYMSVYRAEGVANNRYSPLR